MSKETKTLLAALSVPLVGFALSMTIQFGLGPFSTLITWVAVFAVNGAVLLVWLCGVYLGISKR